MIRHTRSKSNPTRVTRAGAQKHVVKKLKTTVQKVESAASTGEQFDTLEGSQFQHQFPPETSEQRLSLSPAALQPLPPREVTPEAEDELNLPVNVTGAVLRSDEKVDASLFCDDYDMEYLYSAADDVHSEGDEVAVTVHHSGMDDDAKIVECVQSDAAAAGFDLNDYRSLPGAAVEMIPTYYSHTAEDPPNKAFGLTAIKGDNEVLLDLLALGNTDMVAAFGQEENTQLFNDNSWTDFDEPQALDTTGEPNDQWSTPNNATTWAFNFDPALVDPALTAFSNTPVMVESLPMEPVQNAPADITGGELQPARASRRRTTTPSTRKPRVRQPRNPKAIAASKLQHAECVPESVTDENLSSSSVDNQTFFALRGFLAQATGDGPTDVQMSGHPSNTLSIVVPALPTVVAEVPTSSNPPATVISKKRVRTKVYQRTSRTVAGKAILKAELAAAADELDEHLLNAQQRASIDPLTIRSVDGPISFTLGPDISSIPTSLTHGSICVTWANKGDMPAYIEAAYLERVKEFSKNINGAVSSRRARSEGTTVIIPNLPQLAGWICTVCSREFDTGWDLKLHYKTHPKAHDACEHCGKTFTRRSTLIRHINAQHPAYVKFKCACDKVFTKATTLLKHQEKCQT
ncbi:hypothetical protein DFP73DRAFT_598260 [Morchella snyderi]|nr:hypothetical protein DFP73DRAFT_598260 [Morchella snyderi]